MNSFSFHGGRLADAMAQFGMGKAPWIDLSTGINPHGWPGADNLAVDWQALPDTGALNDLEAAAAACFGADPAHVCAVPGTEIGLRMLGDILPGPAIHAQPSYRTHGEMIPRSRPVALTELAGTEEATLIIANPNNPDGQITPPATLLGWLEARRDSAAWLVVDEAFVDAAPHSSLAAHVQDEQRLIIFRSFGKFFGLAGLRLGFVLGDPVVTQALSQALGPWAVSGPAAEIGAAALCDLPWQAAMREELRARAVRLDAMLGERGIHVLGGTSLFRLAQIPDAAGFAARLRQQGIHTRIFDYNPGWMRFGLPADESEFRARLEAVMQG